jgi:hypothetical protein
MGKGDRKPTRWAKDRQRKKKERGQRKAETKGVARGKNPKKR